VKQNKTKTLYIAMGALIFSIILSGCSSNSAEESSMSALNDEAKTCSIVKDQVVNFVSTLDSTEKYTSWDSFKLLTGKDQREKMREAILSVAPFLSESKYANLPYLNAGQGSSSELYSDAEQQLDLLEFFFDKSEGKLLTPEDRQEYLYGDWMEQDNYIGPVVASIFGSYFGDPMIGDPTSDPGICGAEFNWEYWNYEVLGSYGNALDVLEWVKDCNEKTNGDCSKEEYVSTGETTIDTSCGSAKLKITVNDNDPGLSCGTLSFEIFQADNATGDCLALGYWNDRNGVEQVGAFFHCGLEEGLSYTATVRVGRDYTYTNNYGATKSVVSFSLE
jgi:hypothetical protein